MTSAFRPAIQKMAGYVPGEQPQQAGWVKLNTNENPYPPSPMVVDAIQKAATSRLNVYPDPNVSSFRNVAAQLFGVDPDWILAANGSDENLTIITRSFCDAEQQIAYPYPSYVLYESLAAIQGCKIARLRLNDQWQWDTQQAATLRRDTRIFFVPNPNSPTGNLWNKDQLAQLLPNHGVLVLDEAYGDFCLNPHRGELLQDALFDQRMIVTRTLSKSYSLAGIRFGFAVAHPDLIRGMQKVKDSYNCDAVAIAAATAALTDQAWMLRNREMIIATRERLASKLTELGFVVHPSEANFLWTTHPGGNHKAIYDFLKANQILVRHMSFDGPTPNDARKDGLRITIGTNEEIDKLLDVISRAT